MKYLLRAFVLLSFCGSTAMAHPGHDTSSFSAGLTHPLFGLDHLLAMIAIGLWATQCGKHALWIIPAAFVTVMATGAFLGIRQIPLPAVEAGIVASVLLLGLLITFSIRLPLQFGALIAGIFALFHGHAHGMEMAGSSTILYFAGFILFTTILHLLGIGLGLTFSVFNQKYLSRYAGGALTLGALYLIFA